MTLENDPCDRCDGEGKDCQGCKHVREWLEEQRKDESKRD